MTAYTRIVNFLRDVGAECVCEVVGASTTFSEWRLGSQTIALRTDGTGALKLYRLASQSVAGRPDIIMDAVIELAMPGEAAA